MKNRIQIITTVNQPELLETMVENLAHRRSDIGYVNMLVPKIWKAVDSSSTETTVNGTAAFSEMSGDEHDLASIPFATRFLFTCTKAKKGIYKVRWNVSLS